MELTFEEKPCGTVDVQKDGLYTVIDCRCKLVSEAVLRCYVVAGTEVLCLGVLCPEKDWLTLTKRMPHRQWEPWQAGNMLVSKEPPTVHSAWVPWQGKLYDRTVTHGLCQTRGDVTEIALPYSLDEPFDYMEFFCMLTPKNIQGKMYLTCPLP